jgi:hypothetical protein
MNRKLNLLALLALLVLASGTAKAVEPHRCAGDATKQAAKLLTFHFGPDDRIEIRPEVTALAPLKNPVNPKQSFDVLEVWADIYKGRYRMRLLYYTNIPGQCVLMGQEILEYADL